MNNHLDEKITKRALFRFRLVSLVRASVQGGTELSKAVEALAGQSIEDDNGMPCHASRASLYRWYQAFKERGIVGLIDEKPQKHQTNTLSVELVSFLESEKNNDPYASIPEIIRRARQRDIIGKSDIIDRTTLYRKARELDLPIFRRRKQDENPMRPFSYVHRMQMVLCDGKHFRAGESRLKRMVYFYIDDATRYVLHAIVGFSENAELFLTGLYQLVSKHGLMDSIYLDRGPGFIAEASERVCAQLKIAIILGRARYPQGHGKIERFNDTVTQQLLRGLAKAGIETHPNQLQFRILHYLNHGYHQNYHEGIKAIPHEKFTNDARMLNFAYSSEELKNKFTITLKRKVSNDNVIKFSDQIYEIPVGYAGRWVSLYHNFADGRLLFYHLDKLIELKISDVHANARQKRASKHKKEAEDPKNITTAAELSFNNHYSPVVDQDGGFSQKHLDKEDEST